MRAHLHRSWLVLGSCLTLAGAWATYGTARADSGFATLTDDDQARIDRGEIVVRVERSNSALKSFMCVGQVEASAAKVYKAYTDFEHYPEIFNLRDAKILSRDGETIDVRATLIVPWPIRERWVTNETKLSPDLYSFVYKRLDGSITEYTGSLKVVPKGSAECQVYYVAKVDPGVPFMPTWLLNRFQASMLPSSIQSVRDYLKRHPEY